MTEELEAQYRAAAQPFIESGGGPPAVFGLRSWRYFVEINSACNLHCPMCTKGNQEGYDHERGLMSMELLEKILVKIKGENPSAIILPYGNSEPFVHPKLAECISRIKAHGFNCQFSTNLNHIHHVDEVLQAGPDSIIISLSGFTQEIYERGHAGGDIEKVKRHMKLLAEARDRTGFKNDICVSYHIYKDNQGSEYDQMQAYTNSLGFIFIIGRARTITMENTIQYLRHLEEQATGQPVPFIKREGDRDWNVELPPVSEKFKKNIQRLCVGPENARELYAEHPIHKVCPVGDMFTFIRHDGKTSLCACVADRRITLGDFLDTTQEELSAQRRGHGVCNQCLKYRMNLYFHVVDGAKWNGAA